MLGYDKLILNNWRTPDTEEPSISTKGSSTSGQAFLRSDPMFSLFLGAYIIYIVSAVVPPGDRVHKRLLVNNIPLTMSPILDKLTITSSYSSQQRWMTLSNYKLSEKELWVLEATLSNDFVVPKERLNGCRYREKNWTDWHRVVTGFYLFLI